MQLKILRFKNNLYNILTCILVIEKRKAEADKIRERYSERIPVICEKSATSKLPEIDKTK